MIGPGRPRIPVVTLQDHERLIAALDIHGALLKCELRQLNYSTENLVDACLPIIEVDTIIGKIYVPKYKRHFLNEDRGPRSPGRTVNAAIDGAYLRLFIRKNPGQWDIGDPKLLGRMLTEIEQMPSVSVDKKKFYVCGKASGGGITVRSVRRYLLQNNYTIRQKSAGLIIISPTIERYHELNKSFSGLLSLSEYSLESARKENV